jgi:osmotically-inducible protein OsmY
MRAVLSAATFAGMDELIWDPRTVAVSIHDGHVTLRGTVGSAGEKAAAGKSAERMIGVVAVHNELDVQQLTARKRQNAELRAEVLQALMLDDLVPKTIDATVSDGVVTLTGTANRQYERDEAWLVTSRISGALDVVDRVELATAAA